MPAKSTPKKTSVPKTSLLDDVTAEVNGLKARLKGYTAAEREVLEKTGANLLLKAKSELRGVLKKLDRKLQ